MMHSSNKKQKQNKTKNLAFNTCNLLLHYYYFHLLILKIIIIVIIILFCYRIVTKIADVIEVSKANIDVQ